MSPESIKEISTIASSLSGDAQKALIVYYAFQLIKIPAACISIGCLSYVLIKAITSAVRSFEYQEDSDRKAYKMAKRFRDSLRIGTPGPLSDSERLETEKKVLELIDNSRKNQP